MNNQIYISSAELIPEIYSDYNIQSDDFISRFPAWIVNALEELKFRQAVITKEIELEYDDYRCHLPWDFKGMDEVKINGNHIKHFNSSTSKTDNYTPIVDTISVYTPDEIYGKSDIKTVKNEDSDIPSSNSVPYYYINNNWLHTNIKNGKIHLKYHSLPTIFDSNLNMEFPMIYNVGMLKRYLKLYVMRQILIRGYKHPILNLKDNNPIINPGLELMSIRNNVRVACNKFSKDRREVIANILSNNFNC